MANYHNENLVMARCPHCSVAKPLLKLANEIQTVDHTKRKPRLWGVWVCSTCGGVVTGYMLFSSDQERAQKRIVETFPPARTVDEDLPQRAKDYLAQAIESIHSPSGAVMLAASAVDAMLKAKQLKDGSLYSRIKKAAEDGTITRDMETWAHEVRLDANDERHADENADLPTEEDAKRCIDFAQALGTFMFVLPARVQRGLSEATTTPGTGGTSV